MKKLTCEMCGSTDLLKQEGVFVCQACGCKYSVEEAKKMMVEGTVDVTGSTVKIDTSDELANLYQIARRAKDSNDSENAAKYYDMILIKDPSSWEAAFYNVYYRAMQTKVYYISSAASSVYSCLDNVFDLINRNIPDISAKKAAVTEIVLRVTIICKMLESSARSSFKSAIDGTSSGSSAKKYFLEYASRAEPVYKTFFKLGDLIEKNYSSEPDMLKKAATCWEGGIRIWANYYCFYDNPEMLKQTMNSTYVAKIKQYSPSYYIPSPNYDGFPSMWVKAVKVTTSSTTSGSGTSGSGSIGKIIGIVIFIIISIVSCSTK